MKRRKATDDRKEESVRIRLTAEQKELFTEAATKAGLDVSGWLRMIAIREAKKANPA
jgi:uncharacterized protein (DUF1778 family)